MSEMTEPVERALLGSMMYDPLAALTAAEWVKPGDFADPRLEEIFKVVVELARQGGDVDPVSVGDALDRLGALRRAGGFAFVHEVSGEAFSGANVTFYAGAVRERAMWRRLAVTARALAQQALAAEGDPEEALRAATLALEVATGDAPGGAQTLLAAYDAMMDELDKPPKYIPTPWADLNGIIDGWRPGALYVVGARPGIGKTLMGLQAAADASLRGPVAFVSLEMGQPELVRRLCAQIAGVHQGALATHTLTADDWDRIRVARSKVAEMPLRISDVREGSSLPDVRRFVANVRRESGGLSMVVLDYLQLLGRGDKRPRWEAVSELTAGLKLLARTFEVPIIALSQLNRNSASGERQPSLGDLRESGSVEQDADVVMLLQRDDDDVPGASLVNVNVAKNRHGVQGKFQLRWEAIRARLSDV